MQVQSVTQGSLRTKEGRALPLERTEVRAQMTGALADVAVRQVFRNDSGAPIEAVYAFPLPHEASVYRMQFTIEDRVVKGVVKEKAEARRDYERAKSEGRAATLLEEDAPAVFTLSVANVAPGVTIVVELAYQEALTFDDGRWRWVFPMVGPERFVEAPQPPGAAALPRRLSGERAPDVSIEAMVRGDGAIEDLASPSHAVRTRDTDDGVPIVTLTPEGPIANKDFVLTWRAGDLGVRPWLRFERTEGQPGTFLLMLTPSVPKEHTEAVGGRGDLKAVKCGNCGGVIHDLSAIKEIPGLGPVVPCAFCGAILAPGTEVITRATRPRDVLVLIDRSASMRGALPTIQRAVRTLLGALGPGDGAQIMAFDHDRTAFDGDGARFAVVSPELTTLAERFVATLTPRGGTELEEALERAATVPARDGRTRVVVLITDAAVGNEGRLLRRLPELLGPSTRLYVLGVGPAVDRRLVERLARVGGGASDVALAGDPSDETLTRFARRVREGGAVLTHLTLYWENAEMVDVYPKALPDLYGGQPVRVLGRFHTVGLTKLVITGATADGKPFRQELTIGLPPRTERSPGITRLWARKRVEDLAERAATNGPDAAALKAEGTALSIRHSIVSPFTSLVAEDVKVSVDPRSKPQLRLRVTAGPHAGQTFALTGTRVSVGRATDNALQLEDALVSRHHFELVHDGDAWTLRDLQSTSGTWIDGKSFRAGALRPGMSITLGGTTLAFEEIAAVVAAAPPAVRLRSRVTTGAFAAYDGSPAGAPPAPYAESLDVESDELEAPSAHWAFEPPPVPSPFPEPAPMPPGMGSMMGLGGFGPPPSPAPAFGPPPVAPGGFGPPPLAGGPPPMAPGGFGPPPMAAPMPRMGGMPAPMGGMPAPRPAMPAQMPKPMGGMPAAPMPPPMGAPPPPMMPAMAAPMPPPASGARPMAPGAPPAMPPPAFGPPPLSPPAFGPPMSPPAMPPPMPFNPPPPPMFNPPPPPPVFPPPRSSDGAACGRCGKVNPSDLRYCLGCGAELKSAWVAPPRAPVAPVAPASEPYPAAELEWFRARNRGELDLVFLVDETASMEPYIAQVRAQLLALVAELTASPLCRMLRIGIVAYRDHPPQEPTYASRVVPLTDNVAHIRAEVERLKASGGGDGPESVTDGLYDLVRLDWRPSAARAVVWFGDAPPHGVEPSGDAFPQGCPCGHHWFTQAESCREMGVTIYAIGCLPAIRAYKGAEDVFRRVAETTHGEYLVLREASLLVPLIVGAASAELDRQRLDEHVAELIPSAGGHFEATTDGERVRWLASALSARGVRVRAMDFDPNIGTPPPMRFRAVTHADLAGSLDRLRFQGRVQA